MSTTGKIVIVLVVGVVLALGIVALSGFTLGNPWLDGEQEIAKRGDLVIPVTATGTVEPNRIIQIKSKASGEVVHIHIVEGQMVTPGQLLVELDPVDEERNVETRAADLERAESALEKAKVTLLNQQHDLPLQTKLAEQRLVDAQARFEEQEYRWKRILDLEEKNVVPEYERVTAKAAYDTVRASFEMAKHELQRAKNNENILIRTAQEDVRQARAAMTTAQKNLDEAKLRLDETKVRARSAGMVYKISIREGEMIQSGTASLTGGTTLMILADTSLMFVIAQVDEADIGAIRKIAPDFATPGRTQMLSLEEYEHYARRVVTAAENEAAAEALKEDMLGRPVEVTVDAYRSEKFQGVIERILPEPQRVNNAVAFDVRVRLVGDDLDKLMGLQADLSFTSEMIDDVVLVKNEALVSEGRDCFVYLPAGADGREWEKVQVKIGPTDGTYTQIVSGVQEGQAVFTKLPTLTRKEREQREG